MAEDEVRRVLQLEPGFRDARLTLSSILYETRRFTECAAVLEKLLADSPQDREVKARLGLTLEAGGEAARALPLLRETVPAFPQHPALAMALARSEERVGDRDAARRLYESLAQTSSPGELRDEALAALERMALARTPGTN